MANNSDADNISLDDALTATSQMMLRELPEHISVGPIPEGATHIANLPMKEFPSCKIHVLIHAVALSRKVAARSFEVPLAHTIP